MIVAQVLNKIYLTMAQTIARFGRFFCVELLRFNTCGFSGPPELQFSVKISLGDASITEEFLT
jgi:hypothetical protein